MSKRKSDRPANKRVNMKGGIFMAISSILIVTASFGAGAKAESQDSFCASCHTENETVYVDRAHQPAVDLASVHAEEGVRCIDCHSGRGLKGRASAEIQGAENALVFATGQNVQPHRMTRPIPDENCLKCHDGVYKNRDFKNHFHVFLPKWHQVSDKAASCVDCHGGHPTNGDRKIAFLNEKQTVEVCNACHTSGIGE